MLDIPNTGIVKTIKVKKKMKTEYIIMIHTKRLKWIAIREEREIMGGETGARPWVN